MADTTKLISREDGDDQAEEPMPISNAEMADEEAHLIRAINLAVQSAGHLSNLLPAGTLLFFQFLLPLVSEGGNCQGRPVPITMTTILLSGCALWCSFLCFTDTVKSSDGKLYHGIATPHGLWLPSSSRRTTLSTRVLSRFRLRPLDFLHALLSLSVFVATALMTPSVATCFFGPDSSIPSQLQNSLPLVVGFLASLIAILLPSRRREFDQSLLERLEDKLESGNE